jgi:MerR family transcriptional regulator, repressor of the yfmOP operon
MVLTRSAEKASQPPADEAAPERFFLIGEAAERTGLTQRTIRYYEELGLLSPPSRTHGDFRLFSEGDIQRLQEISRLKQLLGFTLAEIRKIADGEEALGQLRSEYRATGDAARRLALLDDALRLTDAQLDLIEAKMSQMKDLQVELRARRTRYIEKRHELEQTLTSTPGHDGNPA